MSSVHPQSSCRRAVQQRGRSCRAIDLRTRQMHRYSRANYRARLQTPLNGRWSRQLFSGRLLLASGTLLAVDRWRYLAHPSSTGDGVAGVLVDGDHGLAFRADVLGIHWLRLATGVISDWSPHLRCTRNAVSSTRGSFGSRSLKVWQRRRYLGVLCERGRG